MTPNIIFIMAGDLGYSATKIPTPHIDSIPSEGMRFTDAHASSAVCTLSRYTVLTNFCTDKRYPIFLNSLNPRLAFFYEKIHMSLPFKTAKISCEDC